MITQSFPGRSVRRGLALASLAAGLLALSAPAFAGSCPAGKMVAGGQGAQPGATAPAGVTDQVLGAIDLAKEPAAIKDRQLRLRRLVIAPGGVVPWHSHGDRPAVIYIVSGEVTEYASTCAVPIVHKAGDTAVEMAATSHWWKNTGRRNVVLLSADILHEKADPKTM